MSGNIQNTLERDKLIFQVQTYFKDTLCDLTEKDDSVEQETLVKAFVVSLNCSCNTVSQLTCRKISILDVHNNADFIQQSVAA